MWAWYGKTTSQLISDLTLPETSHDKIYQKAKTLKEAFSLIIATRYPSFYMQNDPAILGIKTLYELDRLDLTADTTLDFETQQKVNTILNSLYDPEFLREQGFISPYILNTGDPGKVIYSISLFESRPEGNFLRVQSDTLNRPLNISTGIKLEL